MRVIGILVFFVPCLASCVLWAFTAPSFEDFRNKEVGLRFIDSAPGLPKDYVRTEIGGGLEGYEAHWKNGCSYMYIVNISSGIITAWKYTTSDISTCKYKKWGV
jgi:hypothetical protein